MDAYYARLYGLTRDELRYILDPKEVYGEDFPGETFHVQKEKEVRLYGEYRTRRLVLEPWLEVPLDSHVAKGLLRETGSDALPRWRTVIGLSPAENKIFQEFAKEVAKPEHTYRVHLDLLYWRRFDDAQGQ